MKLDKDLMRNILLTVEAQSDPSASYIPFDIPEHDAEVVSYHVMLLAKGDFLDAVDVSDKSQLEWYPRRL